jgi:predicted nuclease of predicted toxin-antitoxin system
MLEAMPDRTDKPNPMARMRFESKDGKTKVKYNVRSLSDIYTYDCESAKQGKNDVLFCQEEPRLADWCQALMVYESDMCTPEKLRELGAKNATDEEINKAIAKAKESFDTNKDNAMYRLNNNNLGNKLQGLLWVKVNERRCRLDIDDMFMTIYNGKRVEDYNPVGKNPFVKYDEGEFVWDHCKDSESLIDLDSPDLPKDLSTLDPNRKQVSGKPVNYHFVGEKWAKAEEGCEYKYTNYAMWRPLNKDVSVAPNEKGELNWKTTHTFAADDIVDVLQGRPGGVYHMVRSKHCALREPETDVLCNAALF